MASTDRSPWRGLAKGLSALFIVILSAACSGPANERLADPQSDAQMIVERSPSDQVAARKREEARRRARGQADEDFAYFRYRIDTASDQPLACFVFSAPLDAQVDYAPFVEFRPNFQASLSVNGRELCVGGLSFGSSRSATLLAGLPAADGRVLKRSETVPIDFDDRPPYVGFRGAGVILPREQADGLPVETVNVSEVRVTVLRVDERALVFKRISAGETRPQGSWSWLWGEDSPEDVGEEIFSGVMAVDSQPNAPVVTVFPLQDVISSMQPGAYFVSVEDTATLSEGDGPPARAGRWILLTDLALTGYHGGHGLDVTLRSLRDGRTVSDATVRLLAANNSVLSEMRPDGEGRVVFASPLMQGTGPMAPRLVIATNPDGELAALDLARPPVDLSANSIGGRRTPGPVDAYVYSDRGIYRPGETVEIAALLRDRAGRQVSERAGHLVIYRPNGLEADRIRFVNPKSGAFLHALELPQAASRGVWRAAIEMDGLSQSAGEMRFSVEDFVPQRIAVELSADEDTPLGPGGVREVGIAARFLYGAPGAGLVVKTEARMEPDPKPFAQYEGFAYGRHDQSFEQQILEFDDSTTDGSGSALVRVSPGTAGSNSGIPLRLNTVVSVLEPGGRAVADSVKIPYRPEPVYFGLRPVFDGSVEEGAAAEFDIVAVDAGGTATARRLNWKILQIDYHYDWYHDGDGWNWRRSRTVTKVNEGVTITPAGGSARITVPGLGWGTHELVVEGQGADASVSASLSFNVGWGGSSAEDGTEAPDRVRIVASGKEPKTGQTTDLMIVPPYDGQAQVVVATDRVLSVQNLAVSTSGTRITLPVTPEWGEGAYVMVSVYSGRDPVLQARPRRAIGVVHVPVDMGSRTIGLEINVPQLVRPRSEQSVELTVAGGPREAVFMTIAAVDEGILRLTGFRSPDPVAHYFGRKALGVEVHDDYGRLLDPNLGMPAEVRTGGDQLGGEGLSVVPVRSVVLYSGLVEVGRNGRARIPFSIPDFNGELRIMAVAWSATGLGRLEHSVKVRDRAPSELIMPRFLAPGDTAVLTASLDNVELEDGQFTTRVVSEGPASVAEAQMTRMLRQGQRADIPVRVSAASQGVSTLRLDVEGPGGFRTDRTYEIETRSPYLPETRVSRSLMRAGETFVADASLVDGYVSGSGAVAIGFSPIPVDAPTLFAALDRYPYGCTEQITSRAVPLLYAGTLASLGKISDPADVRNRVQAAVNTVLNRQGADGTFGLWSEGDGYASPWLGAFVTDFVARAKGAGYSVPDEAMTRAYSALRNVATGDQWRVFGYDTAVPEGRDSNDSAEQMMYRSAAYALYVLARAGEADLSRLRYLHDRELERIDSPLARAHVGAGLALLGDRARAVSAFASAEKALGYRNTGDYYQSPLRDLAGVLALAAEAGLPEVVERLGERLGKEMPDALQLTTQEKTHLLMAVNSLVADKSVSGINVEGSGTAADDAFSYSLSEEDLRAGVRFRLDGPAPLFRTVLVTGAPQTAPPAAASRLSARKRMYTLSGGPLDPERIRQGDRIVIALTLSPEEKRVNPLVVADLLPAGLEIEAVLRPADGEVAEYDWRSGEEKIRRGPFAFLGQIDRPRTIQSRDDRLVAAIDVAGEPVTIAYIVRAVTPGSFAIPGVVAEDMYRPEVFARSAPGRVTILASQGASGGR